MNYCAFCHQVCGQREYCDETCFQEHEYEMKCFQDGIKDEYPVGGDCGEYENNEWDVVGGL